MNQYKPEMHIIHIFVAFLKSIVVIIYVRFTMKWIGMCFDVEFYFLVMNLITMPIMFASINLIMMPILVMNLIMRH